MENVLICGIGALGLTYAVKLNGKCRLKVLVDRERLERYRLKKPVFNGAVQNFDYILPSDSFKPDLIIIAVKNQNLDDIIKNIKNFVNDKTIIISLINGITSEDRIKSAYPQACTLKSFFMGHSAVRVDNSVTQDGAGKIIFEKNERLAAFFEKNGIDYECPQDIDYAVWLKFAVNIFSNQTSAVLNMTFGELKRNVQFIEFAKKLINEVRTVAEKIGIQNTENLERDALRCLSLMSDGGKTSMLQDILAGRKTEADIFAGEIIRLGKVYGVETPCNSVLYNLIKIAEENSEKIKPGL